MNIHHKKSGAVEDPVMSGIVEARKFMEKNGKNIAAVCAGVLAVAVAVLVYTGMNSSNNRKAQEIFGVGILDYQAEQYESALASFVDAAESYRRTPAGSMSAFMAGSILLRQGKPGEAIEWFDIAASGRGTGFVKAQAFEGLAAAYEETGDKQSAVRYLERALRDGGAPHRGSAIRWKLALLNKDNKSLAIAHCEAIIADTLATAYRQRAENMLAVLKSSWDMGTPPPAKVAEEPAEDAAPEETAGAAE